MHAEVLKYWRESARVLTCVMWWYMYGMVGDHLCGIHWPRLRTPTRYPGIKGLTIELRNSARLNFINVLAQEASRASRPWVYIFDEGYFVRPVSERKTTH